MIVILFVSVASGQSVEILFVFKSPFWTKKIQKCGICRFYAIYTKTTLTLQVQTKLSCKRELLGYYIPADFFVTQKSHFVT